MQPTRTGQDNNALLSWHLLKSKVVLHGTIHNDVVNTALQCWNNVGTIRNNVATMLQRCIALKNRCWEVTAAEFSLFMIIRPVTRPYSLENLSLESYKYVS